MKLGSYRTVSKTEKNRRHFAFFLHQPGGRAYRLLQSGSAETEKFENVPGGAYLFGGAGQAQAVRALAILLGARSSPELLNADPKGPSKGGGLPIEVFDDSRMNAQTKKFASTVFKISDDFLEKFRKAEKKAAAEQGAALKRAKLAKGFTRNTVLREVALKIWRIETTSCPNEDRLQDAAHLTDFGLHCCSLSAQEIAPLAVQ